MVVLGMFVSAVVAVTVMHVLLCVCCARVTAVLVWGPGEVWLR